MKIPARYIFILSLLLALVATPFAAHGFNIGATILSFVGLLTGLGGLMLNAAVEELVLGMGQFVRTTLDGPLTLVWTMVRDVVNLTFIFGLLYAGVVTILGVGGGNAKRIVSSIIISALLVNFSLFISKAVIDVANLTSVHIHATMTQGNSALTNYQSTGLSGAFMMKMGLLQLANPTGLKAEDAKWAAEEKSLVYVLIASIFLLVAAFVFAAGALLLAIRFGVLILLMALSPVAFISSSIPGLGGISKQWWHALISQAFFAPAYFFMLLITWQLLAAGSSGKIGSASLTSIFTSGGLQAAKVTVIYFIVLIVGLIASLVVAKKIGAHGASTALNIGDKVRKNAQGWVGRNTAGRLGKAALSGYEKIDARVANSKFGQSKWGKYSRVGLNTLTLGAASDRVVRGGLKAAAKGKYGGSYSLEDDEKYAKEIAAKRSAVARGDKQADAYAFLSDPNNQAYAHMTPQEKLDAEKAYQKTLQGMTAVELENLGAEKLEKIALHLTNKQMDQIKDSKEGFNDNEKERVKDARRDAQLTAVGIDVTLPKQQQVVDATKLNKFLAGMKATDVAKLPADILTSAHAVPHLSGEVLRRILEDETVGPKERALIRSHFENLGLVGPAVPVGVGPQQSAINFLTSNIRGQSF